MKTGTALGPLSRPMMRSGQWSQTTPKLHPIDENLGYRRLADDWLNSNTHYEMLRTDFSFRPSVDSVRCLEMTPDTFSTHFLPDLFGLFDST